MSKHKNSSGIYELTCISHKCSRRFKVIYDTQEVTQVVGGTPLHALRIISTRLTYPFTGCPFCGAWWCTGPLDGGAYPKRKLDPVLPNPVFSAGQQQANALRANLLGGLGALGGGFPGASLLEGLRRPYG